MTLARSGPEGDTYPLAAAFDAFRTAAFFFAAALRKTVREALESIGHYVVQVKGVRDGPPWTSRSKLPSDFVMFVAAPTGRSRIGRTQSRQWPGVARSGDLCVRHDTRLSRRLNTQYFLLSDKWCS